jgi:hypothetical protein
MKVYSARPAQTLRLPMMLLPGRLTCRLPIMIQSKKANRRIDDVDDQTLIGYSQISFATTHQKRRGHMEIVAVNGRDAVLCRRAPLAVC